MVYERDIGLRKMGEKRQCNAESTTRRAVTTYSLIYAAKILHLHNLCSVRCRKQFSSRLIFIACFFHPVYLIFIFIQKGQDFAWV